MNLNCSEAYLVGLLIGKGRISEKKLIIDFNFNKPTVDGLALCPKCGFLAAKPMNPSLQRGLNLRCKNKKCPENEKTEISPEIIPKYNQRKETKDSIKNIVLPFLKKGVDAKFELLDTQSVCCISVELNSRLKEIIKNLFEPNKTSFSNFIIPKYFEGCSKNQKIELVNGLLDTIGFANKGNWRSEAELYRVYFQVVSRNTHLPVSLDNFLRKHFKVPVQTIDWGHPNIRDGNCKEFLNGNESAAIGREHQLKVFPEDLKEFKFRLSSKRKIFDDMVKVNNKFKKGKKNKDWFPPNPIPKRQVKANHPLENSNKIPKKLRKHFDAFWQINLELGCVYMTHLLKNVKDKELFKITGIQNASSCKDDEIANFKAISAEKKNKLGKKLQLKSRTSSTKKNQTEKSTYEPLRNWLEKYVNKKYGDNFTLITADQTISQYLNQSSDEALNSLAEDYKIRPDIISYVTKKNRFIFIESKVVSISLQEVGQLLAYCLVANPIEAMLISTKPISAALLRALSNNKDVLKYGESRIQIGKLANNEVEFIL